MALEPSAAWLAGAITVLVGAGLLIWWGRHLSAGTWEQTIVRQHRWGTRGPLMLLTLVAYVVSSSVLMALVVGGLAQWWLGSTEQAQRPAPQRSPRGAAEH